MVAGRYLLRREQKYEKRNIKTRRIWKTAERYLSSYIKQFLPKKPVIGNEFALYDKISKEIGTSVYFASAYSPERGLNEKTNGLIRRYYPKGTDFNRIPDYELAKTQNLLNSRPRKIL